MLGTEAALRKGYDYLGLFHAGMPSSARVDLNVYLKLRNVTDNLQLQGIQDFETHAVRKCLNTKRLDFQF